MVPGTFSMVAGSKFVNGVKKGINIAMLIIMGTVGFGAATTLTGCPPPEIEIEREFDEYGFDQFGLHKDTGTESCLGGFNKAGIHEETTTKYGPDSYDRDGWDKDGYGRDGYCKDGWDKDGYGRDGYCKDGWHRDEDNMMNKNGTLYKDGYDRAGFDVDGWHMDGREMNKNGTPYCSNGYNRAGLDKDGWQKLDPIAAVKMPVISNNSDQSDAEFDTRSVRNRIAANAGEIYTHFTTHFPTNSHYPPLIAAAIKANNTMVMPLAYVNPSTGPSSQPGNGIMTNSLSIIETFIAEIVQGFDDVADQNHIREIIHAFRINTYVKARKINNASTGATIPNPNPSIAERDTLFNQLELNDNNFEQVIKEEIRKISTTFQINPGHIRTLFNQMETVESGYAVVDDIRALGHNPRENGNSQNDNLIALPIRNLNFIRARLFTAEQGISPSINPNQIIAETGTTKSY